MHDHKVRRAAPLAPLPQSLQLTTRIPPQAQPKNRIAQKVLAAEATELIHGRASR